MYHIQVSLAICLYLESNTFILVALRSLIMTNSQLDEKEILSIPIVIYMNYVLAGITCTLCRLCQHHVSQMAGWA